MSPRNAIFVSQNKIDHLLGKGYRIQKSGEFPQFDIRELELLADEKGLSGKELALLL